MPREHATIGWRRPRIGHGVVHELALIRGVVDAVVDRLGTRRATVVRLEVGALAAVDVDALAFGFEVSTRGTRLAAARLEIVTVPARARCRGCAAVHTVSSLATPCACGSFDRELLAGDELRVKEVEVW